MKFPSRLPLLVACSGLLLQSAPAELLTDADRETLLENLEKLAAASDSKVDARFRLAIAAYRNAVANDSAAMDLYLNCVEKVHFTELHKPLADFREWKRLGAEKLDDPGLRLALRHQLRWLILTLEAASSKPDRPTLTTDAQEALDSIFGEAKKLKNQQDVLGQSVVSSVFAKAYDIGPVVVEKWPMSPIDLAGIYDQILLPPYRKLATLATLRAGWVKRIQQETLKNEEWSQPAPVMKEGREVKRIGLAANMQSPEQLKFLEEGLPTLKWDMEVDLFRFGDESGASVRMLGLLQKFESHPSYKAWSKQFKTMIKPDPLIPDANKLTPPATLEDSH